MLLDIFEVALAGDLLDDPAQQHVTRIAVAPVRARFEQRWLAGNQIEIIRWIYELLAVLEKLRDKEIAEPGRVLQQLPDCDFGRRRLIGIFRHHLAEARVPAQLARLDKLPDRHSSEHLVHGTDTKFGFCITQCAEAPVGKATALVEDRRGAVRYREAPREIGGVCQSVERALGEARDLVRDAAALGQPA